MQEALIAAWRDLRSLRDPDSFRALDRVLVRCVYRAAGRERRQVALRQLLPTVEDSGRTRPGHSRRGTRSTGHSAS